MLGIKREIDVNASVTAITAGRIVLELDLARVYKAITLFREAGEKDGDLEVHVHLPEGRLFGLPIVWRFP